MNKTTLYRYFDSEGQLLYVGITGNPKSRQSDHSKKAEWFSKVSTASYEHFLTREEAMAQELTAIRNESPIHNKAHNYPENGQSSHIQDFGLKLHLIQLGQEKDMYGNKFTPDKAHAEYNIELKSFMNNLDNKNDGLSVDQLVVKKIDSLLADHILEKRIFDCVSFCEYCVKLRATDWFTSTLASLSNSEDKGVRA